MNKVKKNRVSMSGNWHRGEATDKAVLDQIPAVLWTRLTSAELREVVNCINAAYQAGKAEAPVQCWAYDAPDDMLLGLPGGRSITISPTEVLISSAMAEHGEYARYTRLVKGGIK